MSNDKFQDSNELNAEMASNMRQHAQDDPSMQLEYELLVGQLNEEVTRAKRDVDDIEQRIAQLNHQLKALETNERSKALAHEQATEALNATARPGLLATTAVQDQYKRKVQAQKETGDAWEDAKEQLDDVKEQFDTQKEALDAIHAQALHVLHQAESNVMRAQKPPSIGDSIMQSLRGDLANELDNLVIDQDQLEDDVTTQASDAYDDSVMRMSDLSEDTDKLYDSLEEAPSTLDSVSISKTTAETVSLTDTSSKRSFDSRHSSDATTMDETVTLSSSRSSMSSSENQHRRIASRHEREILIDQEKLRRLDDQVFEWTQNVTDKHRLEDALREDNNNLERLNGTRQRIEDDLTQAKSRLKVVNQAIEKSDTDFEAKGFFGRLLVIVSDWFTGMMGGETSRNRYDQHIKLRKELNVEITRLSSMQEENRVSTENLHDTVAYHKRELFDIEQKLQSIDGVVLTKEIQALREKRSEHNLQKDAEHEQAKKDALIKRCERDSSVGVFREKEAPGVVAMKIALKDFLETPTEATLSSLAKIMKKYPDAYQKNNVMAALLRDASADYAEIASFMAPMKKVEARAKEDVALSRSNKISSNFDAIRALEKQQTVLEREQSYYLNLQARHQEELDNLALLQNELVKVRDPHTSIEELSELSDEDELVDGIENNHERINTIREELRHVNDVSDKLQDISTKLDDLRETNDVWIAERNQSINKEVDVLLQRCGEPEKKSMFSSMIGKKESPQSIVKSALKTFLLAPSRENLIVFSNVQKNNPISDPLERQKLDALVNDVLMLVKKDTKGYASAIAARNAGAPQPHIPVTTSFKQQLSEKLPDKNTNVPLEKTAEAPEPMAFRSQ